MPATTPRERAPHAVLKAYYPSIASLRDYLSIILPSTDLAPRIDENERLKQLVDSVVVASPAAWSEHTTYSPSAPSCGILEVGRSIPNLTLVSFAQRRASVRQANAGTNKRCINVRRERAKLWTEMGEHFAFSNATLVNSALRHRLGSTPISHSFRAEFGRVSSPCTSDTPLSLYAHTLIRFNSYSIGDEAMYGVLSNASLFFDLGSSSLSQLTGKSIMLLKPLKDLSKKKRRRQDDLRPQFRPTKRARTGAFVYVST